MREPLPQRRRSELFRFRFGGQNTEFSVSVGFYADGRPGEVFIDGAKSGSDMATALHDAAVLVSLALQHGVPIATIQKTISRNLDGTASGVVGVVVDRLTEYQ